MMDLEERSSLIEIMALIQVEASVPQEVPNLNYHGMILTALHPHNIRCCVDSS